MGGWLYYPGGNEQNAYGIELWRTDGQAGSGHTMMVKDISVGTAWSSCPRELTVLGSNLYFIAGQGNGLWKTDGTSAGTVLVQTLGDYGDIVGTAEGWLYFATTDVAHGTELWRTNGTVTSRFQDIAPGTFSSWTDDVLTIGGNLYITGWSATAGYGVWKSSGTPDDAVLFKATPCTIDEMYWPQNYTVANGQVFFVAPDAADSAESSYALWTLNQYPTASAGGPYTANESGAVTFNASQSSDPNDANLLYRWDFDGNGTWDTPQSSSPTAGHTWPNFWSGQVFVQVSDGDFTKTAASTVTVNVLKQGDQLLVGGYLRK